MWVTNIAMPKYTSVCIHSTMYSVLTSSRSAPMLLILMNPLMAKVLGNIHDTPCHTPGMALCGQLTPARNSSGTEVNTTTSITLSLYLMSGLSDMARKTHASRYGVKKSSRSFPCTMLTNPNILGTISVIHASMTAKMSRYVRLCPNSVAIVP